MTEEDVDCTVGDIWVSRAEGPSAGSEALMVPAVQHCLPRPPVLPFYRPSPPPRITLKSTESSSLRGPESTDAPTGWGGGWGDTGLNVEKEQKDETPET